MKILKKILFILIMIPTTILGWFAFLMLFCIAVAGAFKAVEIWLGAEPIFQVLAVLFLMAATQPRPGTGVEQARK